MFLPSLILRKYFEEQNLPQIREALQNLGQKILDEYRYEGFLEWTIEHSPNINWNGPLNKKVKKGTLEEDESKAIKISPTRLELIESIQFDTELKKSGVWTSNLELEDNASKKEQIKGKYEIKADRFKIKIRNIAGDEIMIDSEELK